MLLPEPPCHTLLTCSKHCHHPTRNNEYSDLSRASHARVYTSYEMDQLYDVTVRAKSLHEDVHASTGHPGYIGMRWHLTSTRQSPPWLIDSSAAISGTSAHCDITNSINCNIPITPAFGSIIRATTEGTISESSVSTVLSPMDIRLLHVDDIHHKLLSLHQVCAGCNNNQRQVGAFTVEGCRFFALDTCWDALKLLSNKKQTFYGLAHNGVYPYSPDANSRST